MTTATNGREERDESITGSWQPEHFKAMAAIRWTFNRLDMGGSYIVLSSFTSIQEILMIVDIIQEILGSSL